MARPETEQPAFEAFFDAHFEQVRAFAARRFGENDADDIAQETMLRAHAHLDRICDGRPVLPWLRTVALRVGIDDQRRRRPASVEPERLVALAAKIPDESDAVNLRLDVGGLLHRAMRRLSTQDREALALHAVHGISIDEIAARTGATTNAIRQRLFRARRNFGRHYRELGGTEYSVVPPAARLRRADITGAVRRVASATQRIATQAGNRSPGRTATALAAVSLGVSLAYVSPPPHGSSHRADSGPRPVMPVLPGLGNAGGAVARRVPGAVARLRDLLGPDRQGDRGVTLPFTESWSNGLAGWDVTGARAATTCTGPSGAACLLRLDPAGSVTVSRRLGVPVVTSTLVSVGLHRVPGAASTAALALALDREALGVTVTLDGDHGGRVQVDSTAADAPVEFALSGGGDSRIDVLLVPGEHAVTVREMNAWDALGQVRLTVKRAPERVDALSLHAELSSSGPNGATFGDVRVLFSPECGNGLDDDGDGSVDRDDAGCETLTDPTESPNPQCNDGIDNDGDGAVDFPADRSCHFARSGSETSICSNGVDDDGDGAADYPDDPKCASAYDDTEVPLCGNGFDDDRDGSPDSVDLGCSGPGDDTEWGCLGAAVDATGLVDPGLRLTWPYNVGLCLDPVARIGTFALARAADGKTVRGYVDRYRIGGHDVTCVSITDGAGTAAPCDEVGTFVARVGVLVRVDAEVSPAERVDLCTAVVVYHVRDTYQNPLDHQPAMVTPC